VRVCKEEGAVSEYGQGCSLDAGDTVKEKKSPTEPDRKTPPARTSDPKSEKKSTISIIKEQHKRMKRSRMTTKGERTEDRAAHRDDAANATEQVVRH